MANYDVQVDARQLLEAFSRMSMKQQTKVHKQALRYALQPIQREARKNLTKARQEIASKPYTAETAYAVNKQGIVYPSYAKRKAEQMATIKTSETMKKMVKAIRIDVNRKADKASVSAMSHPLMHLFALGTVVRHKYSGASTGKMDKKTYLKDAAERWQGEVKGRLEEGIQKAIMKAWQGK